MLFPPTLSNIHPLDVNKYPSQHYPTPLMLTTYFLNNVSYYFLNNVSSINYVTVDEFSFLGLANIYYIPG